VTTDVDGGELEDLLEVEHVVEDEGVGLAAAHSAPLPLSHS